MNLNLAIATDSHKCFFWNNYCDSLRSHIEQIWGWDEEWQKLDFETRWFDCDNRLIRQNDIDIGYIQTKDLKNEHYIMMLVLLPEFRSCGFGRQLMAQIKASAVKKYIGLRVFRTNIKALDFYQSQGFINITNEGDFYYLKQEVL